MSQNSYNNNTKHAQLYKTRSISMYSIYCFSRISIGSITPSGNISKRSPPTLVQTYSSQTYTPPTTSHSANNPPEPPQKTLHHQHPLSKAPKYTISNCHLHTNLNSSGEPSLKFHFTGDLSLCQAIPSALTIRK